MDYPTDPAVRLHNDKFTDGDPVNNIPPSKDSAAHQNALTDEILAVISAAGLTPDEGDLTQLLQAIQKGVGLATSLSANGYQELPGGLILQWCGAVHSSGTTTTITFPIAFPNALLYASANDQGGTGPYTNTWNDSLSTLTTAVFLWSGIPSGYVVFAIGF